MMRESTGDPFVDMVTRIVDAESRIKGLTHTMTLGGLIKDLSAWPPGTPVEFRGCGLDGFVPGDLDSWRGVYADLAFEPVGGITVDVSSVLERCMAAVGQTFTGYKGGDYEMDVDTPVWVDGYGQWTPGRGIKEVRPLYRAGNAVPRLIVLKMHTFEDEW